MKLLNLPYHSCAGTVEGASSCVSCLTRKTSAPQSPKPRALVESLYPEMLARYLESFGIDEHRYAEG